ncbi:NUDIX hydrolase [Paenarthrobacter sp. Z7-10]|uniref:NUDIX hydrolase n=1 Tax=Paenarthrobacter sp. Z7-10 TaxID=2787635 RepID=UPI0022A94BCA|nr:NUDIX hydrolase [Paenarthrobacter sp. Z7-10]MCZ2402131.1 NUDIX hydrolase [Paenarthrobacter sp. Z7-10]
MPRRASGKTAQLPHDDGRPVITVYAAGAVCWRIKKEKFQVLLIHRPRYGDWSWPKGKIDPGETLPETAVREVREEVGMEIRLGIPLPTIHYPVNSGLKEVRYWAAQVVKAKPQADGKEVDSLLWCSPEEAAELLSNPTDREPLRALEEARQNAALQTWPLLVVRHAKAKPRSSWTRAEGDRPLAATGLRQALAVKELLLAWRPRRVVTSPWLRCVATMSPYIKSTGAKVKVVDALTEANHKRQPKKTAAVVDSLFDKHSPVALCTHRPALPTVLARLGRHMSEELRAALPTADPYLSPGEIIICQVNALDNATIVSVEQYRPYDD